ncbi:hypothetical protein AB1L42_01280 [Thalassoglobus sp. JC818]|uniref:hypothetical protein n=1 Tax=Thalassoglobus sp. JC818 TaxID=3232136 RepID=UPI0034599E87
MSRSISSTQSDFVENIQYSEFQDRPSTDFSRSVEQDLESKAHSRFNSAKHDGLVIPSSSTRPLKERVEVMLEGLDQLKPRAAKLGHHFQTQVNEFGSIVNMLNRNGSFENGLKEQMGRPHIAAEPLLSKFEGLGENLKAMATILETLTKPRELGGFEMSKSDAFEFAQQSFWDDGKTKEDLNLIAEKLKIIGAEKHSWAKSSTSSRKMYQHLHTQLDEFNDHHDDLQLGNNPAIMDAISRVEINDFGNGVDNVEESGENLGAMEQIARRLDATREAMITYSDECGLSDIQVHALLRADLSDPSRIDPNLLKKLQEGSTSYEDAVRQIADQNLSERDRAHAHEEVVHIKIQSPKVSHQPPPPKGPDPYTELLARPVAQGGFGMTKANAKKRSSELFALKQELGFRSNREFEAALREIGGTISNTRWTTLNSTVMSNIKSQLQRIANERPVRDRLQQWGVPPEHVSIVKAIATSQVQDSEGDADEFFSSLANNDQRLQTVLNQYADIHQNFMDELTRPVHARGFGMDQNRAERVFTAIAQGKFEPIEDTFQMRRLFNEFNAIGTVGHLKSLYPTQVFSTNKEEMAPSVKVGLDRENLQQQWEQRALGMSRSGYTNWVNAYSERQAASIRAFLNSVQ